MARNVQQVLRQHICRIIILAPAVNKILQQNIYEHIRCRALESGVWRRKAALSKQHENNDLSRHFSSLLSDKPVLRTCLICFHISAQLQMHGFSVLAVFNSSSYDEYAVFSNFSTHFGDNTDTLL